jgi:2-oxoglutarate ferredoxin oxidoreductase subunit alpha
MGIDVTVAIGGEAGQGIQSVGQLLARTCRKAGLYVMGLNDYESRVRGGHSFFQLRISDRQVRAPRRHVNLLIALNRETLELHRKVVVPDGLMLVDTRDAGADASDRLMAIPIAKKAAEAGGRILANTVASGAGLALLGAPLALFHEVIRDQFGEKGEDVVEQNHEAARLGYEAVAGTMFRHAFDWGSREPRGILMEGNQAIALGALAGDCRFGAFYPMSPATGIMTYLAALSDRFPVVIEQVEDEIAAVNMIIGAAYAGVRSMTATSGGGFCLMTEGLGLAGITETPIVIVNAQRPGPATGLPTRTAQGDLLFAIRASQDEFPRFVFAPGSPEECFETVARALGLAEKYQVPAIVLVDHFLVASLYIAEGPLPVSNRIERFVDDAVAADPYGGGGDASGEGKAGGQNPSRDEQTAGGETTSEYRRYALTPGGISPRKLPCRGVDLVVVSGNTHREDGHITETIDDRIRMVEKRNAKIPYMRSEMRPPTAYRGDADCLLVGWGTTSGAIREAVDLLRAEGLDVGALHFVDIWPFPLAAARKALEKASRFFTLEQNSTGQFAQLLRQKTGLSPSRQILKYDGRTFYPEDIAEQIRQYISEA